MIGAPTTHKPQVLPAPALPRETYLSFIWQYSSDRIRLHLSVLAGLPDSCLLMSWDELSLRESAALRQHLIDLLSGHEMNRREYFAGMSRGVVVGA